MTEQPIAPVCAFHPDRQTWVKCSRCGRPICPDCMRAAPVGFHCPQCVAEGQVKRRIRRVNDFQATKWLIGVCLAAFGFESLTGTSLAWQFGLAGYPVFEQGEYYRLVTAMFLHGGLMHIAFNMLILWQLGSMLEPYLGRKTFLSLYFIAGVAGGIASILLNNPMTVSVGASGAIFGLMGAYAVLARRMSRPDTQILVLIGINLVIGFLVPNIDWHAHVGGLIAGAIFGATIDLRR